MLTNRFVKSCKSVRNFQTGGATPFVPGKFTQFYARGCPFDVRSAEMQFCLHYSKQSATAKTLAALQEIRSDVNRCMSFFQNVCFMESGTCMISLQAVDKRSDFTLLVDTNRFVEVSEGKKPRPVNYLFWSMVLGPLMFITLAQPLRGSEAGSVRSAVRDLTAAWYSGASRSE